MESVERIDDIEKLVFQDKTLKEIAIILDCSVSTISRDLNRLQNSNSIEDQNRYKKIKKQVDINSLAKVRKTAIENREYLNKIVVNNKKSIIIQKIANGEMNVFDAANEMHMSIYDFFLYILKLKDVELTLQTILQPYGVFLNEESTKNLMTYPLKTQKEIVLMALTYRVSYKTIAKMFGVSMKNVIETFKTFNDLSLSLDFLFLETYCEDEINEKKAYSDAKKYWKKRNELITSLNEARKNSDGEQAKQIKIQLDELRSEINDRCVLNLKEKKATDLTQEERDLVAKYQLKYYLSSSECGRQFGFDKNTIQRYSASLAERNPIFAEKMILHHKCYQEVNERWVEQYNAKISRRGGGSR